MCFALTGEYLSARRWTAACLGTSPHRAEAMNSKPSTGGLVVGFAVYGAGPVPVAFQAT